MAWGLFLVISWSLVVVVAGVAVLQQWLRWLFIKLRHHQPGPIPIPLLGNLLLLISSPSPHRSLAQLARRYGPLFYLQLGIVPTVIVSTPAAAREILHTNDKSFASRPVSKSGDRLLYSTHKFAFLCPYNDHWRSIRKFYSIHMFNARCHQELHVPIIREEILRAVMGDVYVASRAGSDVNLSKLFSALVQNILFRIVLQKLPVDISTTSTYVLEFTREAERLLGVNRIGEFIPILSFLDRSLNAAIDRCHRSMNAIIEGVVAEREEMKNRLESTPPAAAVDDDDDDDDDGKGKQNCILDDMLASDPPIERDKMKAMILELTLGGTSTTAIALEWVMAELLNNERVMRKAVEEVDRVVGKERMVSLEDVRDNKMPYIRAVVKETLRLHPPSPLLLPHFAAETCDVKLHQHMTADGSARQVVHRISAGTRVLINVWAMGRDQTTWGSTATQFAPERFLVFDGTAGVEAQVDVKGQDFGLLPFGSGRRMCPALVMAMFMLELTIATFLHCFEWRCKERPVDMSEEFGINLIRSSQLHARPTSFRLVEEHSLKPLKNLNMHWRKGSPHAPTSKSSTKEFLSTSSHMP